MDRVTLRYFPVRGRAQALRFALTDAGIDFDDVRVPFADWPERRLDPAVAGPYRALPTLSWGDVTIAETLPIASFVTRRLGQNDGIDDTTITRREAIISSCYIDVLVQLAALLRADQTYPGADLAQGFRTILSRIVLPKLELLDVHLPDAPWVGGERPVVADFFVADALELVRYLLGPERDAALAQRLPRVSALARRVSERPSLVRAHANRPPRFAARADEESLVAGLRAVDLSSVGF
jgi:prostaglandin-H2 D-isomerase / glutathione transferase